MINAITVLNSRHVLRVDQKCLLNEQFGSNNWSIKTFSDTLCTQEFFKTFQNEIQNYTDVIFASSASLLIAEISFISGKYSSLGKPYPRVWILHPEQKFKKIIENKIRFIAEMDSYKLIPII